MIVDSFMSQLEGVRRSSKGRWTAKCPAHPDRTASLSIREGDDGRVLIHCFAGCETQDVLAALGVDWDALFISNVIDLPAKCVERGHSIPFRLGKQDEG